MGKYGWHIRKVEGFLLGGCLGSLFPSPGLILHFYIGRRVPLATVASYFLFCALASRQRCNERSGDSLERVKYHVRD